MIGFKSGSVLLKCGDSFYHEPLFYLNIFIALLHSREEDIWNVLELLGCVPKSMSVALKEKNVHLKQFYTRKILQ